MSGYITACFQLVSLPANRLRNKVLLALLIFTLLPGVSYAANNASSSKMPSKSPAKTVEYLLAPAITGNRADSHLQITPSAGVKEITHSHTSLPHGAVLIAVTPPGDDQFVNVAVKVTNVANATYHATCVLALGSKIWYRAEKQPAGANCNNFPVGGAVNLEAAHTVIGLSTPITPKPAPPRLQFYVTGVTLTAADNNLLATWMTRHDYPKAQLKGYTVSLYEKSHSQPVHKQLHHVDSAAISFSNLPVGTYQLRVVTHADSEGHHPDPAYTNSPEITIAPPLPKTGGYYLLAPVFHHGKADTFVVSGGKIVTPPAPVPPGSVLLLIADEKPQAVRITVKNASSGKTATCDFVINAKKWDIATEEKNQPGCNYFPRTGGSAGTADTPAVIGVSTP